MKINSAKFFKSVFSAAEIPDLDLPEFVFAGRSNVGKSTLINYICKSKNLAKTSSIPGKTQSVNYFMINDNLFFVDLPGYGYAKASMHEREKWKKLIEVYFQRTTHLKLIFLLIDIRHGLLEPDKIMIDWIEHYNYPFIIILNKADKLSNNEINNTKQKIRKELKDTGNLTDIIACSFITGIGYPEIIKVLFL